MRFALSLITNTFPLLSLAFPTVPPPALGFYVSTILEGLLPTRIVYLKVYM
jgi:hypothetical protein